MKIDLSGKTALITGSTAGIGRAIAEGLARIGAEIVVNGRTQKKTDGQRRRSNRKFPAPRCVRLQPMSHPQPVATP